MLFGPVVAGWFRNVLYFRLAGCPIMLPSLKQRLVDISHLARHFLAENAMAGEPPEMHEPVKEFLQRREQPGNIHKLRQLTTRIATRHVGAGPITVGNIPDTERPKLSDVPAPWMDDSFDTAIRRVFCLCIGRKEIGQTSPVNAIRIAVQ